MTDEFQSLFEDNFLDDINAAPTEKLKEGERRIVAILFADISGFTKLSEKMDHEEVRDIIDKLFKLFTSSVEKHGGYVDKYAGDEIMALFGAKVASEVDTHRAISCGMDMLDKLDKFNNYIINDPKYNISNENKLSMRVGINTGMVTTGSIGKGREGDFTVYGDVVNLASRMESNAPINRIMLPEKTMRQAHRNFTFNDYGMIEVKGFEEKISVYLVESAHELGDAQSSVPYIGSRDNIGVLLDVYKSSSDSLGQHHRSDLCAVGIKGEAGIGKSRLISEFINDYGQGIFSNNVIRVASDSVSSSPYQTFISIIKKSLSIDRSDSSDTTLKKFNQGYDEISDVLDGPIADQFIKFKARVAYLLGLKIREQLSDVSGMDLRDEIQLSIRIFIQAICKRSNLSNVPFIIIIDDLQWIDSASMDVLNRIIDIESIGISESDQRNQALYFIFDYRDNYDIPDSISQIKSFCELAVSPFSSDECSDMIRHIMSEDVVPEEVVKVLMKHSGGNPFFIEEWLKSLSDETQWSSSDISLWISSIPESMHSLILSGVDTLDDGPKRVLQCASVAGRKFSTDMIKQLEGKVDNLVDVSASLELLNKEKFIIPEPGDALHFAFKNALTRDVAYDSILKSNKSMLHGILADMIESDYKDEKEELLYPLANHYGRSDNIEKAKIYLVRAAKKSQELYNLHHANNLYKRAIDVYISSDENLKSILDGEMKNVSKDDAAQFVDILHGYSNVLMLLGEMDECEKILSAIKSVVDDELEDKVVQCSMSGAMGKMHFLMGKYDDAQTHFSQQLSLAKELENFEDECHALLYTVRIHRVHGNYEESVKELDALKDRAKDHDYLLSQVLGELGIVHKNIGDLDTALECYKFQEKICIKNKMKSLLITALGNMGIVYLDKNENERALEIFDRVLLLNQEIGDKAILSQAHGNKGIALKNLKRFDDALDEYEMQLKICEYSRNLKGIGIVNTNKGNVYKLLGEHKKARNCFEESLNISIKIGDKRVEGISLANIGETLMEMGEYQQSREYLDKALTIFRENGDKALEKIILDDIKKLESKL